jgi:hypothetical protein
VLTDCSTSNCTDYAAIHQTFEPAQLETNCPPVNATYSISQFATIPYTINAAFTATIESSFLSTDCISIGATFEQSY